MSRVSLRGAHRATWQSRRKLDCFAVLAMTVGLLSPNAHAASSKLASDAPIEINADTLEVFQEENRAVFTGNVVAIQGEVRLKSDKMNVFYKSGSGDKKGTGAPMGDGGIQKIEVTGHVFLSTAQETASGDIGIYEVEKHLIHLNNNVVLTRDKNVLKGDTLTYNFETGKSMLASGGNTQAGAKPGRVRALFVPDKKQDKKP